nr:IS21 family transposase [Streptomyces sp. CJ_13]
MIRVEDWAEIRRLHRAEGLSARAVARQLGISRGTVLRALASDRPPQYQRPLKGSAVDPVEPAIRELLRQTPTMPVTVIAERIGWERGLTILRERVRELRPAYLPVDPVSRTVYQPGELAQCDLWFPAVDIPLGYGQSGRPPVLVIVSGYSRVITARMLPSRQTGDLIDAHWRLLAGGWGAVPKMLVWDNEAGVGKGKLTSEFAAFAGLLAVKVHLCRPRDPEARGLVERANGYLETSFLPGRVFTGPDDFNSQLTAWLQIANRRQHRSIDARPVDRWEADRAAMLTIPPVSPPNWWRFAPHRPRPLHPRRHLRLLRPPTCHRQDCHGPCGQRGGHRHRRQRPGGPTRPLLGQAPVDHRPRSCRRGPSSARRGHPPAGRPSGHRPSRDPGPRQSRHRGRATRTGHLRAHVHPH